MKRKAPGMDDRKPTKRDYYGLTNDERAKLRAALLGMRRRCGTWLKVSAAMDVPPETLRGIARGVDYGSMEIAQRLAKAVNTSLERLFQPPMEPDRCHWCGQKRSAYVVLNLPQELQQEIRGGRHSAGSSDPGSLRSAASPSSRMRRSSWSPSSRSRLVA